MPANSPDEFDVLAINEELYGALDRTKAALRRSKATTERLVEATHQGAYDAMLSAGPLKPVPPPKIHRAKGKPEVALMHLTDWQGHKVTTTYNSAVMQERVLRFMDKVERITEIMRSDHPVNKGVLMFGGDLVEGLFNFPTQVFETDATLFDQYVFTSRLVMQVVRRALALFKEVEVYGEWGNHGRLGPKGSAIPRPDNLDRMILHLAKEVLEAEGNPRLTFHDCPEDTQHVEIGNYRAVLCHGDEFGKNGFVAWSTFVTNVAKWKSGSYGWDFKDCYKGHTHTHREEELPDGEGVVYETGAPESDNRYAILGKALDSKPSQRLHFVNPHKGEVTAQWRIRLTG